MDYRHFELQDLLSEALSAIEGRRWADAETAVRKALRWLEAEWLATPSDACGLTPPLAAADADDDE